MYCNNTDLMQSLIQINNEYIYQCINGSIEVSCFKNSNENQTQEVISDQTKVQVNQTMDISNQTEVIGNQTESIINQTELPGNLTETLEDSTELPGNQTELPVNRTETPVNQTKAQKNQVDPKCTKKIMQCDLSDNEVTGNLYCKKSTLMSKNLIFCNSTTLLNGTIIINGTSINTTTTILNCYEGQVPDKRASFIPTTTQAPTTTTERSLSFSAKAHMFFLRIIGQGDIVDQKPKLTPIAEDIPQLSDNETWIPEALTIPPETTTTSPLTTTEAPFDWWQKVTIQHPNGSFGMVDQPVMKKLVEARELSNSLLIALGSTTTKDPRWYKVYRTTTEMPKISTSTTEAPFEWMMAVPKEYENGTMGTTLIPVPNALIEAQANVSSMFNKTENESTTTNPLWIKVYKTTESSNETTTESTVYDVPYEWMRKKFTEGGDGSEMELVPKDLVEITEKHNYTIPSDWIKVPKNKTLEITTLKP